MTRVQSSKRGASASPAAENRKRTKRGLPPPENSVAAIMQHLLADDQAEPEVDEEEDDHWDWDNFLEQLAAEAAAAPEPRALLALLAPASEQQMVDGEEPQVADAEEHGQAAAVAERGEHDQASHLVTCYMILHDRKFPFWSIHCTFRWSTLRNSCWPTLRNMARQLYLLPRERSMTR